MGIKRLINVKKPVDIEKLVNAKEAIVIYYKYQYWYKKYIIL